MGSELTIARALLELSDDACAQILRQARYDGPHPRACPRCEGRSFSFVRNKPRLSRCRTCRAELSVTAGTPLHGLKSPLGRVLAALVLLTRPGSISTRRLALLFDIHWKDAAALAHKLRHGLAAEHPTLAPERTRLELASFPLRRAPGTRPDDRFAARWVRERLSAAALVDTESGQFVAELVHRDKPLAVQRLVGRHLRGTQEVDWKTCQPFPRLAYAAVVIRSTHRLVSRRWLGVYVSGLSWTPSPREAAHPVFQALRVVSRAPPRTWVEARPPRPQAPAPMTWT